MQAGIPKHLEMWVGSVVTAERVSVCAQACVRVRGEGSPWGCHLIWQHVVSAWR